MMSDEDLQRFSSLLDMTIATARNAENVFLSMQQTLDYAKTYTKSALTEKIGDLEVQLVQSYELLCVATDEIDQLNHDINAILSPGTQP